MAAVKHRPRLVCATANAGKVAEIAAILGGAVDLLPRPAEVADVVEDAETLVGNAELKARAIAVATGLPGLADDTGLEVAAMAGRPGVHTSMLAGPHATDEENWRALLTRLDGVADRSARFRTVAMAVWPDGRRLFAEGTCDGHITTSARGGGGFGYDPVFAPAAGDGRTFAELSGPEKQALSHRGRAFRTLLDLLVADADADADAHAHAHAHEEGGRS